MENPSDIDPLKYSEPTLIRAHHIRRHTQDNADERGASGNGRDALQTGGDKTGAEADPSDGRLAAFCLLCFLFATSADKLTSKDDKEVHLWWSPYP